LRVQNQRNVQLNIILKNLKKLSKFTEEKTFYNQYQSGRAATESVIIDPSRSKNYFAFEKIYNKMADNDVPEELKRQDIEAHIFEKLEKRRTEKSTHYAQKLVEREEQNKESQV